MIIMIVRLLIVFILHVGLPEVSSEVMVGVIGGSVVLPCSGSKDQHTIRDINVHWRHNESLNVYDIIDGVESVENQEPEYKNRTATFSKEYSEGNFSLRLNNLRDNDAGTYSCFIIKDGVNLEVELLIKGGVSQNNSTDAAVDKQTDKSNKGAQTGPEKIVTISLLAIFVLLK